MEKIKFPHLILYTIAIILLLLLISNYAFAKITYTEITVDQKKTYLIEKGFSVDYINGLSESIIRELYILAYGDSMQLIDSIVVSTISNSANNQYIPINELEFQVLTMAYTIEQRVDKIIVIITYNWLTLPSVRGADFIKVEWSENQFGFIPGSFRAEDMWRNRRTGTWSTTQFTPHASMLYQGKLGHFPKLITFQEADRLQGVASFELQPHGQMFLEVPDLSVENLTIQSTSIYAHYTHNNTPQWYISIVVSSFSHLLGILALGLVLVSGIIFLIYRISRCQHCSKTQ